MQLHFLHILPCKAASFDTRLSLKTLPVSIVLQAAVHTLLSLPVTMSRAELLVHVLQERRKVTSFNPDYFFAAGKVFALEYLFNGINLISTLDCTSNPVSTNN